MPARPQSLRKSRRDLLFIEKVLPAKQVGKHASPGADGVVWIGCALLTGAAAAKVTLVPLDPFARLSVMVNPLEKPERSLHVGVYLSRIIATQHDSVEMHDRSAYPSVA